MSCVLFQNLAVLPDMIFLVVGLILVDEIKWKVNIVAAPFWNKV